MLGIVDAFFYGAGIFFTSQQPKKTNYCFDLFYWSNMFKIGHIAFRSHNAVIYLNSCVIQRFNVRLSIENK
jgi:hypothetical protein